jgi:hypothetical protein
MPTYTTTTDVEALLPASLPAAITTAHKNQWVADASKLVDSLVGPRFSLLSSPAGQKFADSPNAPGLIELCARWLGAYFGFLKLREINKADNVPTQGQTYYELAQVNLQMIRDGVADLYSATGAALAAAPGLVSTPEDIDPTFSRGEYTDGVLVSDAGTLDDFSINR